MPGRVVGRPETPLNFGETQIIRRFPSIADHASAPGFAAFKTRLAQLKENLGSTGDANPMSEGHYRVDFHNARLYQFEPALEHLPKEVRTDAEVRQHVDTVRKALDELAPLYAAHQNSPRIASKTELPALVKKMRASGRRGIVLVKTADNAVDGILSALAAHNEKLVVTKR